MALNLALNISTVEDCGSIKIEDITGYYNAASNSEGWGGFNLSPSIESVNLVLKLRVFNFLNEEFYDTPLTFPLQHGIDGQSYNSLDSYEGFKIIISADEVYLALQASISALEIPFPLDLEEAWEILEDTVYEVSVVAQDLTSGLGAQSEILTIGKCYYGNTCDTEKKVSKLFSSIDVECEDCDDSDVNKALLAKSLLKNLNSMITCRL
tara:strand:- start:251 stop:877 length:627 start_codon:yes stop_codon:yes gene_type:complete